jgi:hypothetical protein
MTGMAAVLAGTRISLIDLKNGQQISTFGSWGEIGPGALALSADSRILAAVIVQGGSRNFGLGGQRGVSLEIWDTGVRKLLLTEKAEPGFSIETAVFSPNGRYLAWGGAYFGGTKKGTGVVKIADLSGNGRPSSR